MLKIENVGQKFYYDSRLGLSEPFILSGTMKSYFIFKRWDNMQTVGCDLEDKSTMIIMTDRDIEISKMLNPAAWRKYERINN